MALTKLDRIRQQEGRLILYALRQKWGVPADFYKVSINQTINTIESGKKGVTREVYHISSFLTSAVDLIKKFEYDIGFLAANKNFTYGGFYEPGDRLCVLDGSLVPEGLTVEQEDYFIHDRKRYDIQRVEAFDHQVGWILHLRATKNIKQYAIVHEYVYNHLTIEQDINETL